MRTPALQERAARPGSQALRRAPQAARAIRLATSVLAMKSLIGRPRALTQAQLDTALTTYAAYQAWRALRPKTLSVLAREFGVAEATVRNAIKHSHNFKQPCANPDPVDAFHSGGKG